VTVRLESVAYTGGDGKTNIASYLATPDGDGPQPTVLILRGVVGPDDGYTEIARRLADWGYVALLRGWKSSVSTAEPEGRLWTNGNACPGTSRRYTARCRASGVMLRDAPR